MECYLDSISLPISGEASHQIGDCYCYLCTCGSHKCPSNTEYKRNSPNRMYSTIYRSDYSKKTPDPANPLIRSGELLPSKQKMDLETIHQSDFKGQSSPYMPQTALRSHTVTPYKFTTSSTYQANFPDWQNYSPIHEKTVYQYNDSPLKFTAVSTYGHDFTRFKTEKKVKSKRLESPSLLGNKEFTTGKTMHQITYQPHKPKVYVKKRNNSEYVSLATVNANSTYRQNFLPILPRANVKTKRQMSRWSEIR